MQRLGFSDADLAAYHRTLCAPHSLTVGVALLDLDENPIEAITPRILSGQVTVDINSEATRMLTMELLDPGYALQLDTSTPSDGAMFLDRMVQITYTVWSDELGRHVDCRCFTGVLRKFARVGPVVRLEAHGKERFAIRPAWQQFERNKGTKRIDALRDLLKRIGETKFAGSFTDTTDNLGTLSDKLVVARKDMVWDAAQNKLAKTMHRQLYFNGQGLCILRKQPTTAGPLNFVPGPGGMVLSDIAPDVDATDFVNTVEYKGAKKVAAKVAKLKDENALSAHTLRRGGVDSVWADFEEDSGVKKVSMVAQRAQNILDDRGRDLTNYTYDILPFPHLDELDMATVTNQAGVRVEHTLGQFVIPLTTTNAPPMTVGYVRRVTPVLSKIRRA